MLNDGQAQLAAWVARSGLKQYEVASLLRITQASICNLLKGNKLPGLDLSVRIQDATGIPPRSWLATTAQPKKSRKAA